MKAIDIKSITDREKNKIKTIDPDINDNYKGKTNWTLIIIIIIISIIALVTIGLLFTLVVLHKKKKKDDDVADNNDDNDSIEIEKLNFNEYQNISSSYLVFKNQLFMAFNSEQIGLKSFDFSIKFENKGSSRLLYSIGESIGEQIKSNINGKIKLTIVIKKQINNLNGLFSNITNLQSIDLSGLYMNKIINYDSLFNGCSSLEELKFPINTFSEKVISMNDMFKGCINLNFVNLTSFKITEKTSMNGIFFGCNNLQKIDISSFNFINAGFFNGINLGVNIIFNSFLSEQLKNVTNTLGLKINLFLNGLIKK